MKNPKHFYEGDYYAAAKGKRIDVRSHCPLCFNFVNWLTDKAIPAQKAAKIAEEEQYKRRMAKLQEELAKGGCGVLLLEPEEVRIEREEFHSGMHHRWERAARRTEIKKVIDEAQL